MKRSSLILTLIVAIYALAASQVREEKLNMILGVNNAFVIGIPQADKSFVEKEWKAFMKKYGKVDKVKKTSQWLIQSANLVNYENIGRVNIYAEAMDKSVPTELAVWVQVDSDFINSTDNPDEFQAIVAFLEDFAQKVKIDLITIELEQQQKVLDKYQSNLTRLESEHTKNLNTIDQSHKTIATAEDNVVKNKQDQQSGNADIDNYKNMQDDPDAAKQLKKLEKKQRKLEKDYLAYVNTIAKYKDRIALAETNNVQNLEDQESVKTEMEKQKLVVKEVRDRLTTERAKRGE